MRNLWLAFRLRSVARYPLLLRFVVWANSLLARPLLRRVEGIEHIPAGAFLVAANHLSMLDGFFLPHILNRALAGPVHFISYSELFDITFLGFILRLNQGIVLDRSSQEGIERAIREAEDYLRAGEPVSLFPEAHVARFQRMNRGRPGAARMSLETGAPVLPVGLVGTDQLWPRGGRFRFRWKVVEVRFGKPLDFHGLRSGYAQAPPADRALLLEAVTTVIMRAIASLSGQEYPYGQEALARLAGLYPEILRSLAVDLSPRKNCP